MIKLFLDTEFTDLVPGNKLISIALVDEDGDYFYAELTDSYTEANCSEFVKSNVLPFLKGGEFKMNWYTCAFKLGNWIEDKGGEYIIASDAPSWDMPHLESLLNIAWPMNLIKHKIFPVNVSVEEAARIVKENNYDIHNALDDALVMQKAYKK